eukprot:CAMPEP_0195145624 /NCGR_PEP_ID=MMETSP0448-20130528/170150_1 /TAXON_ID=66468 /ORGANISM="Heterocapsa triquestra, Strain CCMP 448" /LENGTH=31 /DNA_ID= /DNA_START= /DNA_END= /DNA_ORIENTATION=
MRNTQSLEKYMCSRPQGGTPANSAESAEAGV